METYSNNHFLNNFEFCLKYSGWKFLFETLRFNFRFHLHFIRVIFWKISSFKETLIYLTDFCFYYLKLLVLNYNNWNHLTSRNLNRVGFDIDDLSSYICRIRVPKLTATIIWD